ncbi:hypothetical protein ACP8H2_09900 [Bacillus subtilis]|uniref:hypothetical protein n=1 Tax=Bacillus subtilis TaxID=1423 RepID=UPI003CF2E844
MVKKKLKTIKKSISLREDIFEEAEKFADEYFQGNLSAFLAFTVRSYKNGLTTVVQSEPPRTEEDLPKQSKKKLGAINKIMNIAGSGQGRVGG